MKLETDKNLYSLVNNALHETGFTFLYKKELDPDILKTKGALYINKESHVIKYEDKPSDSLDQYNAFWCCFAFRKRVFNQCINFMEKSTLNQSFDLNEIKDTPIYNSKGIEVSDYIDLGTWNEIRRLLINYEKDNNGS